MFARHTILFFVLVLAAHSACHESHRPYRDDDDGGTSSVGGATGSTVVSTGTGIAWGGPCGEDDDCPPGETCNDALDLCGPLGPDGTPCEFEDDCLTGCN